MPAANKESPWETIRTRRVVSLQLENCLPNLSQRTSSYKAGVLLLWDRGPCHIEKVFVGGDRRGLHQVREVELCLISDLAFFNKESTIYWDPIDTINDALEATSKKFSVPITILKPPNFRPRPPKIRFCLKIIVEGELGWVQLQMRGLWRISIKGMLTDQDCPFSFSDSNFQLPKSLFVPNLWVGFENLQFSS